MADRLQDDEADQVAGAFARAIEAALVFDGATAPNPQVGCVLLDAGGKVLITAAHEAAGQPHAEAKAIAMAREAGVYGQIHTVVVTLEPCHHQGRTGPCSAAILQTPARAVWYAVADPNPLAAGGARGLAQAGLQVRPLSSLDHADAALLLAKAQRLAAPFVTRQRLARPFVTVKQALDGLGSMIPPAGQKTFTGPDALRLAHVLRRRADAIVTGSGTILADNPEFTVRHVPDIAGKSRYLCILDRRGRVDASYLAAARARGFRPFIASNLQGALGALAQMGCNEVLVEAGPAIVQSVRDAGLWDEWVRIDRGTPDIITTTTAPHVFAGY